jgi:hypothetical protein
MDGMVGPESGTYYHYKTVTETDESAGAPPDWSEMFKPLGVTGPYGYNWSFGVIQLTAGQSYVHLVEYLKLSDLIDEYNHSIPAVEHWAWGEEIELGFYITDHAKRENDSEASHEQKGIIGDDCGGHGGQ